MEHEEGRGMRIAPVCEEDYGEQAEVVGPDNVIERWGYRLQVRVDAIRRHVVPCGRVTKTGECRGITEKCYPKPPKQQKERALLSM